jgi:hypothetical protein
MTFLKQFQDNQSSRIALIGDIGVYFLATILGFLSHSGESDPSASRMAATFLPFLLGWILIAPWLGSYDPGKIVDLNSVWRPALGALYSAPIGAFGRSVWLNSATLPLFVVIMGGVTAVLLILWRALLTRIVSKVGM